MKTDTISIRVTSEQKEKIKLAAAARNMTVSDYLKTNGSKIGGPKSFRNEVQKLITLSETLSAIRENVNQEQQDKIETTILLLNYILRKVYESKDFQQYNR